MNSRVENVLADGREQFTEPTHLQLRRIEAVQDNLHHLSNTQDKKRRAQQCEHGCTICYGVVCTNAPMSAIKELVDAQVWKHMRDVEASTFGLVDTIFQGCSVGHCW